MEFYLKDFKDKTLVNLSSSILKYFGEEINHPSIDTIDEILNTAKKKKVVVFLFDGLGKKIKEKHLSANDFLCKKEKMIIASNFPPTTACCTKAFLFNQEPLESGFMGWSQYFKKENIVLDILTNELSYSHQDYNKKDFAKRYYPNETIIDKINAHHFAKAIFPYGIEGGNAKDIHQLFDQVDATLNKIDEGFIYSYYLNPDNYIHHEGTTSYKVRREIKLINQKSARIAKDHPDTIFLFIADHGLIDTTYIKIDENEKIWKMLKMRPYLDTRAMLINVKDEYKQSFKEVFYEEYSSEDFLVLTQEEYLKEQIFGSGVIKSGLEENLGDYLIIAKKEKTFIFKDDNQTYRNLVANHSGISEDEYLISVALSNTI